MQRLNSLAPCLSASYVRLHVAGSFAGLPGAWISVTPTDIVSWLCLTIIPNLSTPCKKMTVHLPLYKTEACYMSQAGLELLPQVLEFYFS